MLNWLYRFRNYDEIAVLENKVKFYRERVEQLERETREYKGYKLKYEVTKLYVEDDEALLELFEWADQRANASHLGQADIELQLEAQRQMAMANSCRGLGGSEFGRLFQSGPFGLADWQRWFGLR